MPPRRRTPRAARVAMPSNYDVASAAPPPVSLLVSSQSIDSGTQFPFEYRVDLWSPRQLFRVVVDESADILIVL